MKTAASRLFDELNARYWRSRLPRYRVIRRPAAAMADCLAYCRNSTRTIAVRRELEGEELRLTMLHEMCHIGTDAGWVHGALFRRKVGRLVARGESTLVEDIERYDGTAAQREYERHIAASGAGGNDDRPLRVRVSEDFESLLMAGGSRFRWARVARWLAAEYHLSPAGLRRSMPWAAADWRQMSADERALAKGEAAWRSRASAVSSLNS